MNTYVLVWDNEYGELRILLLQLTWHNRNLEIAWAGEGKPLALGRTCSFLNKGSARVLRMAKLKHCV